MERLDLIRFGCFTNVSLDFTRPGLHVAIGRNQAGKTTILNAVTQLLFGIPHRSRHAFDHALRDLALGALLTGNRGERVEIVRVKRNADTLRDPDGNVISERVLEDLLSGVDETLFTSLFTIGHDEIVRGGAALLASDGDLGRALFGASRAITGVNTVLRRLDELAASLFKPQASVPEVNSAIRSFREHTAEARLLSLSATEVVHLDRALDEARGQSLRLGTRRRDLFTRKGVLARVKATRPLVYARRDHLTTARALETQGPIVEAEVARQLTAASEQRSTNATQLAVAGAAVARLSAQLTHLDTDPQLLERADIIQGLVEESGAYRQNHRDLPELVAEADLTTQRVETLRALVPGTCPMTNDGVPTATVDEIERIEDLAAAFGAIEAPTRVGDRTVG